MARSYSLVLPTSNRTEFNGLPTDNWHHFLRLRDLRQILSEVPLEGVTRVLELGAGDGVQTDALRHQFLEVISIDISPSSELDGVIVADASNLPFIDGYFDLVFSSNVLEHVEQIDDSIVEMKRVLGPNGIMIHSMPTTIWKIVQIVFRPLATLKKTMYTIVFRQPNMVERARPLPAAGSTAAGIKSTERSILSKMLGQVIPSIHGVSSNHLQELLHFRTSWWMRKFRKHELDCFHLSPLFLHSPYDLFSYRFLKLREHLSKIGIASVQSFWLK